MKPTSIHVQQKSETISTNRSTKLGSLAKLPIYILKILNWIPLIAGSKPLLVITVLFHALGGALMLTFLYGLLTVSTPLDLPVPKMLTYGSLSPFLLVALHGYLFLYMQWKKNSHFSLYLRSFETIQYTSKWSTKQTCVLVFLVMHGMFATANASLFSIDIFLSKSSVNVILSFTKDDVVRDILKYIQSTYAVYLFICFYMFTPLLAYVCFHIVNAFRDITLQYQNETNKVCDALLSLNKLVTTTNDHFALGIGLYIVSLVHNVVVWIYMQVVFYDCDLSGKMLPQIVSDCLMIGSTLTLAACIHTEVKHAPFFVEVFLQSFP